MNPKNIIAVILVAILIIFAVKMLNRQDNSPENEFRRGVDNMADNIEEGAKDVKRDLQAVAD